MTEISPYDLPDGTVLGEMLPGGQAGERRGLRDVAYAETSRSCSMAAESLGGGVRGALPARVVTAAATAACVTTRTRPTTRCLDWFLATEMLGLMTGASRSILAGHPWTPAIESFSRAFRWEAERLTEGAMLLHTSTGTARRLLVVHPLLATGQHRGHWLEDVLRGGLGDRRPGEQWIRDCASPRAGRRATRGLETWRGSSRRLRDLVVAGSAGPG